MPVILPRSVIVLLVPVGLFALVIKVELELANDNCRRLYYYLFPVSAFDLNRTVL